MWWFAVAFGQVCTPVDLEASIAASTETMRVKVQSTRSFGAETAYKVKILDVYDGCVAEDQTAWLLTDPAQCGAVLTVGTRYLVTARYDQHVNGKPVFRIDTNTMQAEFATLAQADLDLLGATEATCRRDWWVPAPGTTWQWQLQGNVDTSFDVDAYDIDLFDNDVALIDQLHTDGRAVICYFSAGSWENWRSDAMSFPAAAQGNPLSGWPGEKWLDTRDATVRDLMLARLDLAVTKGCDAVEPDNVDGYSNNSGFPLTSADQLDYNRFLADAAHDRGLSVGLKNALALIPDLRDQFDWALNEECVSFNECAREQSFLDHHKAVFHAEYVSQQGQGAARQAVVCADPTRDGFSTLIKTWDLTSWQLTCP